MGLLICQAADRCNRPSHIGDECRHKKPHDNTGFLCTGGYCIWVKNEGMLVCKEIPEVMSKFNPNALFKRNNQ